MNPRVQMQIFYEIAMELGAEADLQTTARKVLSTYLHKLGCSGGLIARMGAAGWPGGLQPVSWIPRNLRDDGLFRRERARMMEQIAAKGQKAFLASLPVIDALDNHRCYLMELKDFGLLLLVKSGQPFDRTVLHGISRLNIKLAQACLAALYTDELEATVQERTKDLRETNEKLKETLANVKTLSGLLPICASCKKIRDDKGYWNKIETYVRDHSEAEFTHGICPDCVKKLYPQYADEGTPKKKGGKKPR